MVEFSTIGECCTQFEQSLLLTGELGAPRCPHEQWILLGRKIGADNLASVLDEFGGSSTYVQSRQKFFAELFRSVRAGMAWQLRREGLFVEQIAQRLGVSPRTISYDLGAPIAQTLRPNP